MATDFSPRNDKAERSQSLEPAFFGRLNRDQLMQLPDGMIIQSNVFHEPFNPVFEVKLGPRETREALWKKIRECHVDRRTFRGFSSEASYVWWIKMRIKAMLAQRATYDTF